MTKFQMSSVVELGSALELFRGFPTSRATEEGEIPSFSVATLRKGDSARHFASREDIVDVGAQIAQVADVLVAVEGGTVGESLVVVESMGEFVPSQQVATLRVSNLDLIDPWYLGAWLSSEMGRNSLLRLAQGAGIQRITYRNLETLQIALPVLEEQRRIGEQFRVINESIRSHALVITHLEELRDAQLAATFSDLGRNEDESSSGDKKKVDTK